jgi:ribosomal-protein-serine acetyltransferase
VSHNHAGELFAAIERNRDRLRRWLPWLDENYSVDHTVRFLEERIDENETRSALTAVIVWNGHLCGAIGLHRFDPRNRSTSIGYWIDAQHEGLGIATRACGAVVTFGFRNFGLHRIEIRCATGNHRSCAVPLRLGFREEGLLREAEWLYDHFVDLRVFSMLETEWQKVTRY